MPTIQEALCSQLNGVASGGVFPLTAEQNVAPPYIVYTRVPSAIENTLSGNGNPPINNTRFQLDVWASTYAQAQSTAAAVRAAMQSWSVQNVQLMEHDEYEPDVRLFRVIMDFSVWHY